MSEPLAYLNGQFVPFSQLAIGVTDVGFVQGVTIAEQLRTFGGKLFRLDKHLQRLARSLEIVGVDPGLSLEQIGEVAIDLAGRNHALLDPADDLGLTMFITPGVYATYATAAGHHGPTVCLHTYPLPFVQWVEKYRVGESLVVTDVAQVPAACWPLELKCRSRMHYYLADRAARQIDPGARALLLDQAGYVSEASTANVLTYFRDAGIVSPPKEMILPGVSVAVVEELAAGLSIPFSHRRLTSDELAAADEVLLCSTSPCIWSVTRLNGRLIAGETPGPVSAQLRQAWSALVGLDIEGQARAFSTRAS